MARTRASTGLCLAVLCLFVALAIGGCGGGSPDASAVGSDTGQPTETLPRQARPELEAGEGLPPEKLVVKNLQEGTGAEAQKGDRVRIQYYGVDWRSGLEHANSWRYESIPVFILGEHRLLRGLNRGIAGMREGGSREIIIPHNLVYYPDAKSHRKLSPLDALIYRVYLVDVLDTSKS